MRAAAVLFGLLLAGASLAQAPKILLVQRPSEETIANSQELPVLMELAEAFAKDGRVSPIRWSESDPAFKSSLGDRPFVAVPTDEEISEAARKLGARYIMTVEATRTDTRLFPRADLFQSGRRGTIWTTGPRRTSTTESVVVLIGDRPDWPNTARSLAGTWTTQLFFGPFKDLQPGAPVPVQETLPSLKIEATAGEAALEQAELLVAQGRADMAILYLKDAIDLNPFEPQRRIRLMELLSQAGLAQQAADEGRRAALLSPGNSELWLLAAKSWIIAGEPDEAAADVQQAQARGANTPLAHRLLGDIALLRGDLAKSRDEYSIALEKENSLRTRLGLALAFALAGQPDLSEAIMQKTLIPADGLTQADYSFVLELMDEASKQLTKALADLPPRARTAPRSQPVVTDATNLERRCRALSTLLGGIKPPARHQSSHESRVLAHKLLSQASAEILAFARGADPEAGSEAILSLGEALRQLGTAREAYRVERIYGAGSAPASAGGTE